MVELYSFKEQFNALYDKSNIFQILKHSYILDCHLCIMHPDWCHELKLRLKKLCCDNIIYVQQ